MKAPTTPVGPLRVLFGPNQKFSQQSTSVVQRMSNSEPRRADRFETILALGWGVPKVICVALIL